MSDIPFGDPESFGEQEPADCSDAPLQDFDFRMGSLPDDTEGDRPDGLAEDPSYLVPIGERPTFNPMTAPDDIGQEIAPEPEVSVREVIPGLSFIVPHDGTQAEVSIAEQALVARGFSSLVDDVLLGRVNSLDPTGDRDRSDSILLKLPLSEAYYLDIGVDSKAEEYLSRETPPSANAVLKNIDVQRCTADRGV